MLAVCWRAWGLSVSWELTLESPVWVCIGRPTVETSVQRWQQRLELLLKGNPSFFFPFLFCPNYEPSMSGRGLPPSVCWLPCQSSVPRPELLGNYYSAQVDISQLMITLVYLVNAIVIISCRNFLWPQAPLSPILSLTGAPCSISSWHWPQCKNVSEE